MPEDVLKQLAQITGQPSGQFALTGPSDTWESLQRTYSVPAADIAKANGLDPGTPIRPGMRLSIPHAAAPQNVGPSPLLQELQQGLRTPATAAPPAAPAAAPPASPLLQDLQRRLSKPEPGSLAAELEFELQRADAPGAGGALARITGLPAAISQSGHALAREFGESLGRSEDEMFDAHTTYAGRVLDIPRDVLSEVRKGVEMVQSTGQPPAPGENPMAHRGKDVFQALRGLMRTVLSPLTGATISMAARPVAERMNLTFRGGARPQDQHWLSANEPVAGRDTTAEQFAQRSIFQRTLAATPRASIEFKERERASEEDIDKLTAAMTFVMPGTGIVRYRDIMRRLAGTGPAKAIERIFSPTTVGDDISETAERMIRGEMGTASRDSAVAEAAVNAHRSAVMRLPPDQQLDIQMAVEEGRINGLAPQLRPVARAMNRALNDRANSLSQLQVGNDIDFVENWFPHMWKDPAAAQQAFAARPGGGSRMGSGASLHARTIPTIADGLAAGLEPITRDPVEMFLRYINNIDRFIASERIREALIAEGYGRWIRPRVYGASGHPQPVRTPPDWQPLQGRGATRVDGSQLWAPEDFARVYNNFVGTRMNQDWTRVFEAARHTTNFMTQLELSLSGYHALAMTHEAAVSQMASAIQNIIGGTRGLDALQVLKGVKQAATHPIAAIGRAARGRELQHEYLGTRRGPVGRLRADTRAFFGLSPGSPDMSRIAGLLERAGGRAAGSRHAQISASEANNYWQAFKLGGYRMRPLLDALAGSYTGATRTSRMANFVVGTLGRAMDTLYHPLFNVYIPRLKNGAFYDTMSTWLQNHPNATYAEQLRAARVTWDSIDNRFGEMVQDNIFWSSTLKRAAQLAMRSYSWNMGTLREIGGGIGDIARGRGAATSAADHQNVLLDSHRAAYVIALPIAAGTMAAIYQYLMTGQGPQDLSDLMAPRTGATVMGPGVPSLKPFARTQHAEDEERVMLPGYQKDVFGWYNDWQTEAINKLATVPRTGMQVLANRDWRDLMIADPEGSAPEWLKQYFDFVLKSYGPITARQEQKPDSAIGGQSWLGIREAPAYLMDPENAAEARRRRNIRDWQKKQNIDRRHEQMYENE